MKKTHFVKYILLLILILAISSWLILMANGYKINPQNYKLEKTGMIYLESTPAQVQVYISNQLKSQDTPYKLADIFPQRYDIRLSVEGFSGWQETLWVQPEQVSERKYIVLFYQKPKEIELTDSQKEVYKKIFANTDENINRNLYIKENNEIWFGDILVTRLSTSIEKTVWYWDKKHILYQSGPTIFVMDANGSNIIKLIDLKNAGTTNFLSADNGETLVYQDGPELHKIKITQNNGIINELTPNILR